MSRSDLAFEGAEGFGCYAKGGRGGPAYVVTTLDDTDGAESRQGTLRHAVETAGRPLVVGFDPQLCGVVRLTRKLKIKGERLTVDGSSAGGAGICVAGAPVVVRATDVVLRYLRFRGAAGLDDMSAYAGDALTITGPSEHVIVDHCSCSWGTDEVLSVNPADGTHATNVTLQHCIVSEPLGRDARGRDHRFGGILSGGDGDRLSVLHCLWVHCNSRAPRVGHHEDAAGPGVRLPCYLDFRCNVLYNAGKQWGYNGEETDAPNRMNFVGNAFVSGPDTERRTHVFFERGSRRARAFFRNNAVDGVPTRAGEHYDVVRFDGDLWTAAEIEEYMATPEFPVPASTRTVEDWRDVWSGVLAGAGCVRPMRDAVDARLVRECKDRSGSLVTPHSLSDAPERYRLPRLVPRRRAALCIADGEFDALRNDLEAFADLVREQGYSEVRCVVDATKKEFRDGMKWLVADGMQPGDRAFFYAGAHGTRRAAADDVHEGDGWDEVLATADKPLPDDDIRRLLTAQVPDGAFLFAVIPACHSGTAGDMEHNYSWRRRPSPTGDGSSRLAFRYRDDGYPDETGNVAVFTACDDAESTWVHVYEGKKHSALGGALLAELRWILHPSAEPCSYRRLLRFLAEVHEREGIDAIPHLACHPKRYYREQVAL